MFSTVLTCLLDTRDSERKLSKALAQETRLQNGTHLHARNDAWAYTSGGGDDNSNDANSTWQITRGRASHAPPRSLFSPEQ